jgi:hypothetical protein
MVAPVVTSVNVTVEPATFGVSVATSVVVVTPRDVVPGVPATIVRVGVAAVMVSVLVALPDV